ncbi:MAG TPA: hypothetical protein QF753_08445 [Victivallales bacterium]|nr:hypothetical protein [Victivallales bacterium]
MSLSSKFANWFNKNWLDAGGLITPATAADYIGIKRQSVHYLIMTDKIRKFVFEYKHEYVDENDNPMPDIPEEITSRIYVSFEDTRKYKDKKIANERKRADFEGYEHEE